MIAGQLHAPREYRGTVIEKMLPVDIDRRGLPAGAFDQTSQSKVWHPVLTPEGQLHPMTRFLGDIEANKRLWAKLPGFFWHYPIARAKPGALTLLTHPYARSSYGPQPLMCVQYYGAGKCAFMAFDSTWRWRDRVGDKYQAKFWGQIVRDLSQNKLIGRSKRYQISTSKSTYRLGEKVGIYARILDEKFEPVNPDKSGSVDVKIDVPGLDRMTVRLSASENEPGRFRGRFIPRVSGRYRLELVTHETGLLEETLTHDFLVRLSMLEFQDAHMNRTGLVKLAQLTGGKFFHVDQLDELTRSILQLKATAVREVNDELWNTPAIFLIFAGLFVTELIYRKRRRLL